MALAGNICIENLDTRRPDRETLSKVRKAGVV